MRGGDLDFTDMCPCLNLGGTELSGFFESENRDLFRKRLGKTANVGIDLEWSFHPFRAGLVRPY